MDDRTTSRLARHPQEQAVAKLTQREREVLRLITPWRGSDDAARELGISRETARTHIKNARAKLGGLTAPAAARVLAEVEGYHPTAGNRDWGMPNALLAPLPNEPRRWRQLLPLRQRGASGNDLNIAFRLLWIPVLAATLAIGFGMSAVGTKVVSDFLNGVAER